MTARRRVFWGSIICVGLLGIAVWTAQTVEGKLGLPVRERCVSGYEPIRCMRRVLDVEGVRQAELTWPEESEVTVITYVAGEREVCKGGSGGRLECINP